MAFSKMSGFFKRDKQDDEARLNGSEEKSGYCTIGAVINYTIIVDFVAIFIACLIIVGSLGTLRSDVSKSQETLNSTATCYMYAGYDKDPCTFNLDSAHTCDGMMVGFSFIAVMAVGYVFGFFIKAILRHDLNWTLYIELPVLVVCIILVFALSVTISIGNVTTCTALKGYRQCKGEANVCTGNFYNSTTFSHNARANVAQNTAWFVFLFVFVAIIFLVVRLVVFLKRRKKQAIQRTLDREDFNYDDDGDTEGPKAI